MNGGQFLAAIMLAAGSSLALAQSGEVSNAVPIFVFWSDPIEPSGVSFDTTQSGEQAFLTDGHSFKGLRRGSGIWLEHNVSLHYPSFSIPLVLRTWYDEERLQINGSLWKVSCNRDSIARIRRVNERSSQRDIIGAIIAARYLSKRPASVCPPGVTREMGQRYYNLSCNFAKKADFFGLSSDAREAYLEFNGSAPEEVAACAVQSQGLVVKKLYDQQADAVASRNWAEVTSLYGELDQLERNDHWKDAFAAQRVTRRSFETNIVIRDYNQSLEAGRRNELQEALKINRDLQKRAADQANGGAFKDAGVAIRQLEDDETYFETRLRGLEQARSDNAEMDG